MVMVSDCGSHCVPSHLCRVLEQKADVELSLPFILVAVDNQLGQGLPGSGFLSDCLDVSKDSLHSARGELGG